MANCSLPFACVLVLITLAAVFSVVSLGTDYWATTNIKLNHTLQDNQTMFSVTGGKGHYGLLRVYNCRNLTNYECGYKWLRDLSEVELDYLNGCLSAISLAFLSNLFALFTMLCLIADCGSQSMSGFIKKITVVLLMIAAACNLIAVIVFAIKDEKALRAEPGVSEPGVELDHHFGWSWGLMIVAVLFEIIALFVILTSEPKKDYQEQI